MPTLTHLIIHEHELTLKGENRGWFEDRLIEAARRVFEGLISDTVERAGGRLIFTLRIKAAVDHDEIARRSRRLLGAAFVMAARQLQPDLSVILNEVKNLRYAEILRRFTHQDDKRIVHKNKGKTPTFKIHTQRSDKTFPHTSQETNEIVGNAVQEATGWTVKLDDPDVTVYVEILRNAAYVGVDRFDCPGGLPVGTSGRFLVLLSGGIDSPVAAHEIMKRGGTCDFIHFQSIPFTSRASVDKVEALVAVLHTFQGRGRLHTIPFADIQREIVMNAPDEFRILLYRRFMVRIAERIARETGCSGLVTGDNLGQVASQTIENITAVEDAATLPMLRPLLTWNKDDIIRRARKIGTYDISIQPHDDCCTVLMPKNPSTRARVEDVRAAEEGLDIEHLSLLRAERSEAKQSSAWIASSSRDTGLLAMTE